MNTRFSLLLRSVPRFLILPAAMLALLLPADSFARGFGGGGRGGGGFRGGGDSFGRSEGGFGGQSRDGFGGQGFGQSRDQGFGGQSRDSFGGQGFGAQGRDGFGGQGFGGQGRDGFGGQGFNQGREGAYASPSRSQLNSFLGLPSDEGMPHAGAAGYAAGNRNQPQFSGAQGAAVGAGVANRNQPRFSGAQGAAVGYAAGQNSFGRGFSQVSASTRYNTAAAVRGNFNNYGIYGRGWNVDHPGAWAAAGWTANNAWRAASWATAAAWCGCASSAPVSYDYGSNVTYQDNSVYVNGDSQGTSSQYYDQASQLASTGTAAAAPSDGDWLPLGVFSFTQSGQTSSNITVQLAINKQGIVRGNYTDAVTNELIHGSLDKETQRLAFTIGDNTQNVIETGLYNLSKDEAPALVHFGKDRTEQWLLVRLKQNSDASQPPAPPSP